MDINNKEEETHEIKYQSTPDEVAVDQIKQESYFEDMSVEHEPGESPIKEKDGDGGLNSELVAK